jgi:hypothetical protein
MYKMQLHFKKIIKLLNHKYNIEIKITKIKIKKLKH